MNDSALIRYIVLLVDYADPTKRAWGDFTEAEQAEVVAAHGAFDRAVKEREGCTMVLGEELAGPDATTVFRRAEGRTILTDGSYTESIEMIGGLYIIDAPDLDTLVELLEIMPAYVYEIRPAVRG